MISPLFVSILTTGFVVAFLHGALPNHWLPFVLVGRRQAGRPARPWPSPPSPGSATPW